MHLEGRLVLEPNKVHNVNTNEQFYIDHSKFTSNNNTPTPLLHSNSVDKTTQKEISREENASFDDFRKLQPYDFELLESSISEEYLSSVTQFEYSPANSLSANSEQFSVLGTPLTQECLLSSQFNSNSVTQIEYSPANSLSANSEQFSVLGTPLTQECLLSSQFNSNSDIKRNKSNFLNCFIYLISFYFRIL